MRGFPLADGPEGSKTALFSENRQQDLERRYLTEKLVKKGVPIFWHFLAILGISGENRVPD